jgi:nitrogen fixation protein FixH
MQYLQQDTKGKKIIVEVGMDISAASVLRIYYRKPDGTKSYWTATEHTARSITHTLAASELDQAGIWQVQPYAVVGDEEIFGDIERFLVKENL